MFNETSLEIQDQIKQVAFAHIEQSCTLAGDFIGDSGKFSKSSRTGMIEICPLTGKRVEDLDFEERNRFFTWTRTSGMYEIGDAPCIGGSDAATVFGKNKYKTAYELWEEKTGKRMPDYSLEQLRAMNCGHLFEKPYRLLFSELTGLTTVEFPYQFIVNDSPHILLNVDGLVMKEGGDLGLYEGKSISAAQYGIIKLWKQGVVPDTHWFQIQAYMAALGLPFTYICAGWGPRVSDIAFVEVEADRDAGKVILDTMQDFSLMCKEGIAPDLIVSDVIDPERVRKVLNRLYGGQGQGSLTITDDEDVIAKAKRYAEAKDLAEERKIKRRQEEEEDEAMLANLENEMLGEVILPQNIERLHIRTAEFSADWRYYQKYQNRLQTDSLKEVHPDIVAAFTKNVPTKNMTVQEKHWK